MESADESQATLEEPLVPSIELQLGAEDLSRKVKEMSLEKDKILEEFGHQRAKMKEFYLQKDEELKRALSEKERLVEEVTKLGADLDEARSQVLLEGFRKEECLEEEKRRYQEEISSLQQLVQETIEESSMSRARLESDLRHLQQENERLVVELQALHTPAFVPPAAPPPEQGGGPMLALTAVTKTLARKLGADTSTTTQDNLEDSMRKAQEDAEVLRSLVIPLEEEIQVLKDKLRSTDKELQRYQGDAVLEEALEPVNRENISLEETSRVSSPVKATAGSEVSQHRDHSPQRLSVSTKNTRSLSANSLSSLNESPDKTVKQDIDSYNRNEHPEPAEGCDMCSNYEAQLVRAQQRSRDMERQLGVSERTCERLREDLGKESTFRKEMEERWSQKKEEHKAQVAELKKQMVLAENEMRDLRNAFQLLHGEVLERLNSLSHQREQVQQQLVRLQEENDQLVGKHSVAAETLQNERIDFPDTVEDLQELLLKCRDDLIRSKLASERLEEDVRTIQCENQLLRAQMDAEQAGRVSMEDNLSAELDNLKTELHQVKRECKVQQGSVENLQLTMTVHQETISDLKSRLDTALRAKKHLEDTVAELRSRVASLQQELDNSEAVQKDFVRLSQSLQVQLERIRDTDMEVRWQHDEDIDECQGCHTSFSVARRKQHCRHCGRIFCGSCLSHTVLSGPHQRPSRVCDVCHTLLVRDTAPYFSTEPPHTPD